MSMSISATPKQEFVLFLPFSPSTERYHRRSWLALGPTERASWQAARLASCEHSPVRILVSKPTISYTLPTHLMIPFIITFSGTSYVRPWTLSSVNELNGLLI